MGQILLLVINEMDGRAGPRDLAAGPLRAVLGQSRAL